MNWPVAIDWDSPAGKLLTLLGDCVPADRRTPIVLFGSAALQVTVAPTVLSDYADIAPDIIPYDPRSGMFPNPYDRVGPSATRQCPLDALAKANQCSKRYPRPHFAGSGG